MGPPSLPTQGSAVPGLLPGIKVTIHLGELAKLREMAAQARSLWLGRTGRSSLTVAPGEPQVGFPSSRGHIAFKEEGDGRDAQEVRSGFPGSAVRLVRETGKPIARWPGTWGLA